MRLLLFKSIPEYNQATKIKFNEFPGQINYNLHSSKLLVTFKERYEDGDRPK